MELDYYNKIKSIGSVQLKGIEIALVEMIKSEMISENITASGLIKLCIDFTDTQRVLYENSKIDQSYGNDLTNL